MEKTTDKAALKAQIHSLKQERDAALQEHNSEQLRSVRRRIHRLKRRIRRLGVQPA